MERKPTRKWWHVRSPILDNLLCRLPIVIFQGGKKQKRTCWKVKQAWREHSGSHIWVAGGGISLTWTIGRIIRCAGRTRCFVSSATVLARSKYREKTSFVRSIPMTGTV